MKSVVEMSEKRSPAADLIGSNADLLSEILFLLPAKSLFKFKLVSRRWNLLISDKSLLNRWLFHREHAFILRHQYDKKPEFFYGGSDAYLGKSEFFICDLTVNELSGFKFPFDFPYIKILQSTNGLLLVHCRNWQLNHFYVFNPTTMEKRLILSKEDNVFRFFIHLYLIFDPQVSENYKVVSFSSPSIDGGADYIAVGERIHFCVYDSGTHTWTNEGWSEMSLDYSFQFPAGLNHDGGVYFIREEVSSLFYSPEEKRLREVPCPPERKGGIVEMEPDENGVISLIVPRRNKHFVVQSNGHLHCLQIHFKEKKNKYHGKVLEMVEGEWIVCKLKLKLRIVEEVELVGMIRKERIEESVFVFQVAGGRVMKFGFGDESGEVVVEHGIDLSKCRGLVEIYGFDESIGEVFVDHGIFLCNCRGHRPPVLENAHPFIHSFASV